MRKLLQTLSALALLGIITPPLLYLIGSLTKPAMSTWMLVATLLWFATVPFWMGRKPAE